MALLQAQTGGFHRGLVEQGLRDGGLRRVKFLVLTLEEGFGRAYLKVLIVLDFKGLRKGEQAQGQVGLGLGEVGFIQGELGLAFIDFGLGNAPILKELPGLLQLLGGEFLLPAGDFDLFLAVKHLHIEGHHVEFQVELGGFLVHLGGLQVEGIGFGGVVEAQTLELRQGKVCAKRSRGGIVGNINTCIRRRLTESKVFARAGTQGGKPSVFAGFVLVFGLLPGQLGLLQIKVVRQGMVDALVKRPHFLGLGTENRCKK